jgi:hypothetical protein
MEQYPNLYWPGYCNHPSGRNIKTKVFLSTINIVQKIWAQRPSKDELITSLIECTGRLFTAATRHKQRCCDIKIDEKGTLKATEQDKYENIAGLV